MELPAPRLSSRMDSSALKCGTGRCTARSIFLKGAAHSLARRRASCFNDRSGAPTLLSSSDFAGSRVLMTDFFVPYSAGYGWKTMLPHRLGRCGKSESAAGLRILGSHCLKVLTGSPPSQKRSGRAPKYRV
jgi:hypothetical protein